jgi:hypothetical protein
MKDQLASSHNNAGFLILTEPARQVVFLAEQLFYFCYFGRSSCAMIANWAFLITRLTREKFHYMWLRSSVSRPIDQGGFRKSESKKVDLVHSPTVSSINVA